MQSRKGNGRSQTASSVIRIENSATGKLQHRKYMKPLTTHLLEEPPRMRPSAMFNHTAQSSAPIAEYQPQIIEFLNMADFTHQTVCDVPVEEPIFQPSPPEVCFRSFEPLLSYETEICLRNNDRFARRVKILPPDSPYFILKCLNSAGQKIAPGMECKYTLTFRPDESKDHTLDLVVVTEREKFLIPVSAIGPRGSFTLPDAVDFGPCAVRSESFKTLLVRNMGNVTAGFAISNEEPFFASPQTAMLRPEEAIQVTISFIPEYLEEHSSDLRIEYNTGEVVWMECRGSAVELPIKLHETYLIMEPTYLQLFSQKSIVLVNDSDIVARFSWRLLPSASEERKARMRLTQDAGHTPGSIEQDDIDRMIFEFTDDCFSISPQMGELYPRSKREITITFSPKEALAYSCTAYLDVDGRLKRVPLQLQAEGVGARVFLSYNILDVKEVIVNSKNVFELHLENHGDIDCRFEYAAQHTLFAPQFVFSPSEGILAKGDKQRVSITFTPTLLGEFVEEFHWSLMGTPRPLIFTVKGVVVGPSFEVNLNELAFNKVSVGFLSSKTVQISNTCDIPFHCIFRVPEDGTMLSREFDVIPASCIIPAQGVQSVQVDFIPLAINKYNVELIMDIEDVGEAQLRIPISCEGVVPNVSAAQDSIDFGEVFLRYSYTRMLELVNHSPLPAKFELVPQDELSYCVASFTVDQNKGLIPPNSEAVIAITFQAQRLGKIKLPLQFKILGSPDEPVQIFLQCCGTGPKIVLKPKEIAWGNVNVLQTQSRRLRLTNESLIPAEYKMFTMKKASSFKVDQKEGVIPPNDELDINVSVLLNDTAQFKDELIIAITEGEDLCVPLSAKGVGTTIYCEHPLDTVHFGNLLSSRTFSRDFVLTNKGTKVHSLTWVNISAIKMRAEHEKAANAEKDPEARRKMREENQPIVAFSVEPEKITLQPGEHFILTVHASYPRPGTVSEKFNCRASVDKVQKVIFETTMIADFVNPLLELSSNCLSFEYKYAPGETIHPYTQVMTITNVTALPLEMSARAQPPFMVEPEDLNLDLGESRELAVTFDPGWKSDRLSTKLKQKITISYQDHPQKDFVDLVGNIVFPNLKFDKTVVDFGAILNDTTRRMRLLATNNADVPNLFSWHIVVDQDDIDRDTKKGLPPIGINSVFDVLPIRSGLQPGASEWVEFVFYGHPNRKFTANAVCSVEGGPQYTLKLTGAGYDIQYKFETTSLDFGLQSFDRFAEQEMFIYNPGKVRFDFSINTDAVEAPTMVVVTPKVGRVAPKDKIKLLVKFYAGTPAKINTTFTVQIAHFPAQTVTVLGEGVFPHIHVSLPRVDQSEFSQRLQEAMRAVPMLSRKDTDLSQSAPTKTKTTTIQLPPPTASDPDPRSASPIESTTRKDTDAMSKASMNSKVTNPWQLLVEAEADKMAMRHYIISKVHQYEAEADLKRPRRVHLLQGDDLGGVTFDLDEPDELVDAPLVPLESRRSLRDPSGENADDAEILNGSHPEEDGSEGEQAFSPPKSTTPGPNIPSASQTPSMPISSAPTPEIRPPTTSAGTHGEGGDARPSTTSQPAAGSVSGGDRADLSSRHSEARPGTSSQEKVAILEAGSVIAEEPQAVEPTIAEEGEPDFMNDLGDDLRSELEHSGNVVFRNPRRGIATAAGHFTAQTHQVEDEDEYGASADRDSLYDLLDNEGKPPPPAEEQLSEHQPPSPSRSAAPEAVGGSVSSRGVGATPAPSTTTLRKTPSQSKASTQTGRNLTTAPSNNSAIDEADVTLTGKPKDSLPWMDLSKFVLSHYLCDFGNIIKGTSKTKKFRITNLGNSQVSFDLSKSVKTMLQNGGYVFEPDRVSRLPPDLEHVDFSVSFNSARPGIVLGVTELDVPIDMKGGPRVIVHLRANVTIPEVELSTESLFFGTVYTHQCRTMPIQLTNRKEIPCEWSFTQAVDANKRVAEFSTEPSQGTLLPGEQVNVFVKFTPTHDRAYSSKLPLKIAQNNAKRSVRLKAAGAELRLRFDPPVLLPPPVLPFLMTTEALTQVYNDSDVAVEIYSLDLDDKYKEEEDVLRFIGGYDQHHSRLLPVREPGQPLQKEILEAQKDETDRRERARLREEKIRKAQEEGVDPEGLEDMEEMVGDLLDLVEPSTISVMVYGPPLSGKSALSDALAKKFTVAVIRIDDLLEECMGPEAQGDMAMIGEILKQQIQLLATIAENSSKVPVAATPAKGGKVDPAVAAAAQALAEAEAQLKKKKIKVWQLAAVIRTRLMALDCARGVVIDGLDSKYIGEQRLVAKAFLIALAPNKKLYFFHTLATSGSEPSIFGSPTPHPPSSAGTGGAQDVLSQSASFVHPSPSPNVDLPPTAEVDESSEADLAEIEARRVAREAAAKKMSEEASKRKEVYDKCSGPVLELMRKVFDIKAPPTPVEVEPPPIDPKAKAPAAAKGKPKQPEPEPEPEEPEPVEEQVAVKVVIEFESPFNGGAASRSPFYEELPPHVAAHVTSFTDALADEHLPDPEPLPGQPRLLKIPPPVTRQIVKKPAPRPDRKTSKNFVLFTKLDEEPEPEPVPEAQKVPPSPVPGQKGQRPPSTNSAAPAPAATPTLGGPLTPGDTRRSRWMIPPKSSVALGVRFSSVDIGTHQTVFGFEIMGAPFREFQLPIKGECAHPSMSTDPRNVFYRKIKSRTETQIVHKQFVLSTSTFEFGPLLIGKQRGPDYATAHPDNREKFRVSNNGLFPMHVDFAMESDPEGKMWLVEPASVKLAPEEVAEISVFAFPNEVGTHENRLICCIKDNPEPAFIKLSCIGSTPELVVDSSEIKFDRLLIKRRDFKSVQVTNVSKLPCRWRLVGAEDLGSEFTIVPTSGSLEPGAKCPINIEFQAIDSKVVDKELILQAFDVDSLLKEPHKTKLALKAEAYNIEIDVQFPKGPDRGLDYGVIKVVDRPSEVFTLLNRGKYEIGFKFQFKKSKTGELFTITPSEGVLPPMDAPPPADEKPAKGAKVAAKGKAPVVEPTKIEVVFESKDETLLANNNDLKCLISEVLTGEVIVTLPVNISVRAVFSKFRVLPSKGINFGALVFNTKKSRTFEIQNKGEFEFTYELVPLQDGSRPSTSQQQRAIEGGVTAPAPAAAPAAAKKAAAPPPKGKAAAAAATAPIVLGNFTISPANGSIPPGGQKTLTIDFNAEGSRQYFENMGIVISESDPRQDPRGMPYELSGESCTPGINTSDFDDIFEEQSVVKKLDPLKTQHNVFTEEEKVFHFGPAIVSQQVEVRFKISNPTKVACNVDLVAKLATPGSGAAPAAGAKGGKKEAAPAPGAGDVAVFEVQPQKLNIPMHEHRYVTVFFTPSALSTFNGRFEANVENGIDPTMSQLWFTLRGEGTLPRISVVQPTTRTPTGLPMVNFGKRTLIGKTVMEKIKLVNEGVIPSTIRFDSMAGASSCFNFTGKGAQIMLQPKQEQQFELSFTPKEAKDYTTEIKLSVQHNQFEDTTISITGTGYVQDVSFEDLPHGHVDTLAFGGTPTGIAKPVSFRLQNHTAESYRFSWGKHGDVKFSPSAGHLLPYSTKDVTATFCPLRPCEHLSLEIPVDLTRIRHRGPLQDWDDRMTSVQWVVEEPTGVRKPLAIEAAESDEESELGSPAIRRARLRKGGAKRVVETIPEPEYDILAVVSTPSPAVGAGRPSSATTAVAAAAAASAAATAMKLRVTGVAHYISHSLASAAPIVFRDTMMFQQRAFKFPFKNPGPVPFEYNWNVLDTSGAFDTGPFTVTPEHGTLDAGASIDITVTFSPDDSGDYERTLVADIPNLDFRPVIPEPTEEEKKAAAEAAAAAAAAASKPGKGKPPAPTAKGAAAAAAAAAAEPVGSPLFAALGPAETAALAEQAMLRPSVSLKGKSLRPLCHFELVDSDWLSAGRRPPTMSGPGGSVQPIDPTTRVIEFESLGTRVKNTKRFYVVNPTNVAYEYAWECEDSTGAAGMQLAKTFRCGSRKGVVLSGKKAECWFEYTPEEDVVLESFWRFTIAEHRISVPFILVGHVVEPSVQFDTTFLNFNALLLGGRATQTVALINREHIPFTFAMDQSSYGVDDSAGHPPVLRFEPASGQVSPDSALPIQVTFAPNLEKHFNFNVICNVRSKATRLALNVKGEGYAVHAQALLEDPLDGKTTISSPSPGSNVVDFGDVQVNEKRVRQIVITNSGKFPLDFEWTTTKHRALTIVPEASSVPKGEKVTVILAYHPMSEGALRDHKATLSLNNGPKFQYVLRGGARRPQLRFSFTELDFGACFLWRQGMVPATSILTISNEDRVDISYDCSWESKQWLDVSAAPTVLAAGESKEIRIQFTPPDVGEYGETVPFDVNGLYTVNVNIKGVGCERRVELVNPQQMTTDFGTVRVGQTVSRAIKFVNKSKAVAHCSLAATAALYLPLDIRLRPSERFTLGPKESFTLELVFNPQRRQLPFTHDVIMEIDSVSTVACVLRGSAAGLEAKFDSDMLFFGAVVANSRTVRRLQLENIGDIGTKFSWPVERIRPDFTIEPADGFIAPHDEVTFDVTFHPHRISDDIRYDKIPMVMDQGDTLYLTLTGMCVAQAPTGEAISFATAVRQSQTKSLPPLKNPTDGAWSIKPVIDNDFWSGAEVLEIAPGKEGVFSLMYTPLTMTRDGKHTGSIFFPLPNGTAVLYSLTGTAEAPTAAGTVTRTVKAKSRHYENLLVKNWSSVPQRFKVVIAVSSGASATTTITCADSIDVPAHLEKELRVRFHTYVEGKTSAKATFTNEKTGEYLFYNLEFTATAADVLDTISMETIVRQPVSHKFLVDNPLQTSVTLNGTSTCKDVSFALGGYVLAPSSTSPVEIFYRPLLEGEGKATVTLTSTELGVFVYALKLSASSAGANRSMQFKSALGTSDIQTFRFSHLLNDKADYKCTVDNGDYIVETPTVTAQAATNPAGVECSVDVRYEPSSLGSSMGRLQVVSATGGEFVCILHGHCEPPRPQGPIELKSGGTASISFKNIFAKPTLFAFLVDNPAFVITSKIAEMKAKETSTVTLSYKGPAPGVITMAKLQISCEGSPPWIFYLRGS